jgi:hypothetical protein
MDGGLDRNFEEIAKRETEFTPKPRLEDSALIERLVITSMPIWRPSKTVQPTSITWRKSGKGTAVSAAQKEHFAKLVAIIHAAMLTHDVGGEGSNMSRAMKGEAVLQVCTIVITVSSEAKDQKWTRVSLPKVDYPASLWATTLFVSPGGQADVAITHKGRTAPEREFHVGSKGVAYALPSFALDTYDLDTRVMKGSHASMFVGLAWAQPITVQAGERWDFQSTGRLRLLIDQDTGPYAADRFDLGEESASTNTGSGRRKKMRTNKRVCLWCTHKEATAAALREHIRTHHRHGHTDAQIAEEYEPGLHTYWAWRRYDLICARILDVERRQGIDACCTTIRKPEKDRPACLAEWDTAHKEFEQGIPIGHRRRPSFYIFKSGLDQDTMRKTRVIANSEESDKKHSVIHDKTNSSYTSRIIPYADEKAVAYLNERLNDKGDGRQQCVLTDEATTTSRREVTAHTLHALMSLARSVGEPTTLRSFIEIIFCTEKAPGQVAHMDIYGFDPNPLNTSGAGWNFTWILEGSKGTLLKKYQYQGFPDNFTPGISTLPTTSWDNLPDEELGYTEPGMVLMFRANHIHAGASGKRTMGFACQATNEDVDEYVLTHRVIVKNKKVRLPADAPDEVKRVVANAAARTTEAPQ